MSARPQLITDRHNLKLFDVVSQTYVGIPGLFGRDRIVQALPLNGTGPVLLTRDGVVIDIHGMGVADPQGILLGQDGIWIHRYLKADKVEETRA